ncbi:MAG: hypothetical protein IKR71_10545 [Bacteroidales bacterium]|nr:hypothetical protein [Bacteroidales bacterium]
MHYIFIINGRRDYAHITDDLKSQLEGLNFKYTIYETTGVGDATRYTRIYCDLHRDEEVCFVACGGSGTTNEVASGIVGETNKSMAVWAYGATNDLLKSLPERNFRSVKQLLQGEEMVLDILKVNDNYALNVCNFGFDSIVAYEANFQSEKGVDNPYQRGILLALLGARFNRIKVVADGKALNKWMIFSCALANGRYVGGQFHCAPKAEVNDGEIDICLIRPMTLLSFIRTYPYYVRGEHVQPRFSRKIYYGRARHVEVHSRNMIYMVLDGELLPGSDFTIDIIPKAVRFVLPAE